MFKTLQLKPNLNTIVWNVIAIGELCGRCSRRSLGSVAFKSHSRIIYMKNTL